MLVVVGLVEGQGQGQEGHCTQQEASRLAWCTMLTRWSVPLKLPSTALHGYS